MTSSYGGVEDPAGWTTVGMGGSNPSGTQTSQGRAGAAGLERDRVPLLRADRAVVRDIDAATRLLPQSGLHLGAQAVLADEGDGFSEVEDRWQWFGGVHTSSVPVAAGIRKAAGGNLWTTWPTRALWTTKESQLSRPTQSNRDSSVPEGPTTGDFTSGGSLWQDW